MRQDQLVLVAEQVPSVALVGVQMRTRPVDARMRRRVCLYAVAAGTSLRTRLSVKLPAEPLVCAAKPLPS